MDPMLLESEGVVGVNEVDKHKNTRKSRGNTICFAKITCFSFLVDVQNKHSNTKLIILVCTECIYCAPADLEIYDVPTSCDWDGQTRNVHSTHSPGPYAIVTVFLKRVFFQFYV